MGLGLPVVELADNLGFAQFTGQIAQGPLIEPELLSNLGPGFTIYKSGAQRLVAPLPRVVGTQEELGDILICLFWTS